MTNKYRLRSSVYARETDDQKIAPQKIFFLSVEGNLTEKEYFNGISNYRKELGINMKVDVEVLRRGRKDNNSAPEQVIELLEEYLRLRETGAESLVKDIPKDFVEKYGVDFIEDYLEDSSSVTKKRKNQFVTDLMKIGYDINYRKYLQKYNNDLDEFAILIDRDAQTHSETNMQECIEYCNEKQYKCYIANPCFEFWLLLHLSDVKKEYADKLDLIKENEKLSEHHTYVSKEVSDKAHHGKSGIGFATNYLPYVNDAISRAKEFASDEVALIDNVGCNVWKMLEDMKIEVKNT